MTTFVDTSALYALLDADDDNHSAAGSWFSGADAAVERLVTHNYVVVETAALVHRRLGAAAVRALMTELLPALDVRFIGEGLHTRATAAYLAGIARGASLVDRVSFELMREEGLTDAFAFDRDFSTEGFRTRPGR